MIPVPTGVRVWLVTGHTDMRKGFASLSLQVQEVLRRDPLSGHLFCFRGRRGDLLKVIWHDGQGACLFTKRLERGRFLYISPDFSPGRGGSDTDRSSPLFGPAATSSASLSTSASKVFLPSRRCNSRTWF